ncbi:MAG: hypothetical protein JWS10_847 [Cypionkella sp.]|uniref:hypothetical protein n=1 Tax=Cypionkella sp. TaxID=2811411 RepID=UPI00261300A5|nr:hypothetical protein [Cypionkella sp.]MDB5658232.1 hypothetical protein [Cypionkella sp.]
MRAAASFDGSGGFAATELNAALEPARVMFRELLIERIMAFEAYRRLAEQSEHPQVEMVRIADIAHKIAGVGGTLGFAKAGALAGDLDRSITENPAKFAESGYLQRVADPLLEALLVEMEALLDD